MTDPQNSPESTPPPATDPKPDLWNDVAKDFQNLGQSIANAVRTALQDDRNQQHLHEMRAGIEDALSKASKSIDEALKSPKTEEVKSEVKKVVTDAKTFGDKVYTESKPQLVQVLKSLNEGISQFIQQLETSAAPAEKTEEKKETDSSTDA